MNRRQARRLATNRLAAAARILAAEAGEAEEFGPADRRRIQRAFGDLAHELEVRTGVVPRTPRLVLVDPDQAHLFDLEGNHS